jgi:hypothetical protein
MVFFKRTSYEVTMLTNSIQMIKKIQVFFYKQSMHYYENHLFLKVYH